MKKSNRLCPNCKVQTSIVRVPVRVRRGDRVLPVEMATFECTNGGLNEAGDRPLRFVDQALGAQNDAEARDAWRTAFGEEMPTRQRPGRKPDERRSLGIRVMLTPSELAALDAARGDVSRSEFLRQYGLAGLRRSA